MSNCLTESGKNLLGLVKIFRMQIIRMLLLQSGKYSELIYTICLLVLVLINLLLGQQYFIYIKEVSYPNHAPGCHNHNYTFHKYLTTSLFETKVKSTFCHKEHEPPMLGFKPRKYIRKLKVFTSLTMLPSKC